MNGPMQTVIYAGVAYMVVRFCWGGMVGIGLFVGFVILC